MERLTEKIHNTNCVAGCGSNCKYGFEYCHKENWENCETISDVIDKLAKYEDLEEQGRLIKLPCKVGDTVYVIVGKNISVQKIQRATIDSEMKIEFCTKRRGFALFNIGKTVYLIKWQSGLKSLSMCLTM